MTSDLNQGGEILRAIKRLEQTSKGDHGWAWMIKATIPVVVSLVIWGVSVEVRMATMQTDIRNVPGNSWLRDDVQEIKERQKEILTRLRDIEKAK